MHVALTTLPCAAALASDGGTVIIKDAVAMQLIKYAYDRRKRKT
jgi:hypothetical protein